jgi:FRG domain
MPQIDKITTVADFIDKLSKLPLAAGNVRFFRGHADYKKFDLKPSVYRKSYLITNEESMIQEAIIRCPADFPDRSSFFEHLVRLQHYGLPTRLLDLTSNALVALYFACKDKEKTEGEVLVLDIPKSEIKYYSSDTVSVISNLARRPNWFSLSALPDDTKEFNKQEEIGRLVHDIRKDKPGFRPLVEKSDLSRVIAVRAKLDNARIARQDGAFLLFGITDKKRECAQVPADWITCGNDSYRIVFSNKHKIKRELEQFGVSEQSLFPELESQSKSIQTKFSRKYARKKKKK